MATAAVFAVSGAAFASWVSRLPAVRDRLGAGEAELGLALLAPAVGSLLTMPFVGRLCSRWGSRRVVIATALPAAGVLAALPHSGSIPALAAVLFVWGALYGAWDVAMNIHGSEVERRAARAWMPRYHACWSVGGFLGAAAGALAARGGVSVGAHLAVAGLTCALVLVVAVRRFVDDRGQDAGDRGQDAGDRGDDAGPVPEQAPPRESLLSRRLVGIGVITICATLAEGAAADWLAIYLADERSAGESAAAAGFTLFAVAMAAARFAGTTVIERLGRVVTLRAAGVVLAVGVAVTLAAPGLAGAYAGALLWGLGVAIVFPAAMSAAGDTDSRSNDAIALVSTIGYSGFMFGPPTIGFLAEATGLGRALWVVTVMGVAIVGLAVASAPRDRRGRTLHGSQEHATS